MARAGALHRPNLAEALERCLPHVPRTSGDDPTWLSRHSEFRIHLSLVRDVLKIDVDGFDGKVLSGARGILMQHVPNVIFEWHPILYRRTGNDYLKPFQVLVDCGYRTFVWFTKFGEFSHFTCGRDLEALEMTAQLCLREKHVDDWHYDVVALHSESVISPLNLAELSYAKRRVSRW